MAVYSKEYGKLLDINSYVTKFTFSFTFEATENRENGFFPGTHYTIVRHLKEFKRYFRELYSLYCNSYDGKVKYFGKDKVEKYIDLEWLYILVWQSLPKHERYGESYEIYEGISVLTHIALKLYEGESSDNIKKLYHDILIEKINDGFNSAHAEMVAEELFDSIVPESQFFKENSYMDVIGADGDVWRIVARNHWNVFCRAKNKMYCCVVEGVPFYDMWAAQRLAIKFSLDTFLEYANTEKYKGSTDEQYSYNGRKWRLQSVLESREREGSPDGTGHVRSAA